MKQAVLNQTLRHLAEQYAVAARQVLGDRLTSIVLFGSVARGQAASGSDIDLLVVCRDLPTGAFRRQEVLEPVRERLLADLDRLWAQGIYADFSEVIKSETEAQHTHPVYLDMTEDAEILFDRDGFFADVLPPPAGRNATTDEQMTNEQIANRRSDHRLRITDYASLFTHDD